jgi:hypothetical protein
MAKRTPVLSEAEPVSLINLDPAAAARSIDTLVAEANDEKDWLEEKVTIQFYNTEEPGNKAFFCYGKCDDPTSLTLEHNEVKELTRGVVRFIESRQTPIYAYKADGSGKMRKTLIGWKPRFQCRQVNVRPSR